MRFGSLFLSGVIVFVATGCERADVSPPPRKVVEVKAPGVHVEVQKKDAHRGGGAKVKVDVDK